MPRSKRSSQPEAVLASNEASGGSKRHCPSLQSQPSTRAAAAGTGAEQLLMMPLQQPLCGLSLPFWAAGGAPSNRSLQGAVSQPAAAQEGIQLSQQEQSIHLAPDTSPQISLSLVAKPTGPHAGLEQYDTEDTASSSSSTTSSDTGGAADQQPQHQHQHHAHAGGRDDEGDSSCITLNHCQQQQQTQQQAADPFSFGQRALAVPDLSGFDAWERVDSAASALLALAAL